MLSELNLKFKSKFQTVKGKGVAVLGFRVMDLYDEKKKVFITSYDTVCACIQKMFPGLRLCNMT